MNGEIYPFWNDDVVLNYSNTINLILLAHVQHPRGHRNPAQLQCSETELFSIEEFNEIYQGIVSAGYYIQAVYFNELDFISEYIAHPEHFNNCLIYNLARNGLGDNKKTIIPAFCELVGLKYSTSSSLFCAMCRNKYYFSTLLQAHDIPVPKSWLLSDTKVWLNDMPTDGTYVICKPSAESASQGVNVTNIFPASQNAFNKLPAIEYIVQSYVEGEECEVPVFKVGESIMVLPPVGINLYGNKILDENASATNHYEFYSLEKTQSQSTIEKIRLFAKKTFELLRMDVYGRIDFRIDSQGNPYVFDVSTTPYTTVHSSFAFAFEHLGYTYNDIYKAIISSALLNPHVQNDKNWRSDNKNPRP